MVYLNDIVITGDDSRGMAKSKQSLQQQFHSKDLGTLRYFLGIEVARSQAGIQRKHLHDLLKRDRL